MRKRERKRERKKMNTAKSTRNDKRWPYLNRKSYINKRLNAKL